MSLGEYIARVWDPRDTRTDQGDFPITGLTKGWQYTIICRADVADPIRIGLIREDKLTYRRRVYGASSAITIAPPEDGLFRSVIDQSDRSEQAVNFYHPYITGQPYVRIPVRPKVSFSLRGEHFCIGETLILIDHAFDNPLLMYDSRTGLRSPLEVGGYLNIESQHIKVSPIQSAKGVRFIQLTFPMLLPGEHKTYRYRVTIPIDAPRPLARLKAEMTKGLYNGAAIVGVLRQAGFNSEVFMIH